MNVNELASVAAGKAGELAAGLMGLFTSATRLYRLEGEGGVGELLVESWTGREALNAPFEWQVHALSARADLALAPLLGQRASLLTVLADGSLVRRSGLIREAALLASDGGFARYRLRLAPWTWLLTQTQRQRTWQDKTVVQIIEAVFSLYQPHARWRWSDEVPHFLADTRARSLCTQGRETDWAFVLRLLAEEGLGLRHEEGSDGVVAVLFADSAAVPEDITSSSSVGGAGIRFHRASSQEQQDSIQAFGAQRRYASARTTQQSWDYKAKRSVSAQVPTAQRFSGPNAALLEAYDPLGAYAHANSAEAQRYATLAQQHLEAGYEQHLGRSGVRSLRAGTWFTLTQGTDSQLGALLGQDSPATDYLVLGVQHVGLNNLPKDHNAAIAKTLGADPLLAELGASLGEDLCRQAQATGYANTFTALARGTPWRPEPILKPSAAGPASAIVVGPQGETEASGAGEVHTDALGRIRVRFHWQDSAEADTASNTTWVRVAQPYAGPGYGSHFIPRVGQEVLLGFIGNDLDRPVVLGSLYNGRGEAGVPATPGGATAQADLAPLQQSTDHRAGAQGNRIGSGHSPAWHGAGAAEQANAAAVSGLKTQEFGGPGYNQLAFDDSDAQLRVQLKTTQHETQLNLGHLVHQADNHRGSFRGVGFEVRTDAWGAVRARGGVLISSYGTQDSEPSGDNAAALALAQQAQALAEAFSRAAGTHQTVQLSTLVGLRPAEAPPLQAMHAALNHQEPIADTQVPHSGEPIVAIAAKAGLAIAAGQDLQFSNGQALHLGSGQDTTLASGGALRVHTGQALAMLGGAVKAGSQAAGTGLSFIAAQGDLTLQAQADAMEIAAKQLLNIQSASTKVDLASPKKITLATTGGASITLENGSLTVMCPGKITVKAATKSMVGAGSVSYELPLMPRGVCVQCLLNAQATASPVSSR